MAFLACRPAPPPSLLLLVSVDTLRADRLGAYGSDRGLTPNLDRLARESTVFTAAYAAAPFTLPSVSSLLTGRYPEAIGIWSNESLLVDSLPTLATRLRAAGWRTAAVVSNWVLRRSSGLATGFDRYDAEFPQREAVRGWPERIAADTTDAALATLDAWAAEGPGPRFLWVHYQDPHGPYTPPAGQRERYLERERAAPDGRRLLELNEDHSGVGGIPLYQSLDGEREVAFYRAGYDGEVAYLDGEIGRLLAGLEARAARAAAVIVFTADHGESLGEQDLWFAHGERLTSVLMQVPLLLCVPGEDARTRDDVVSLVDLYPTVLRLLGAGEPDADLPGRDLLAPEAERGSSTVYLATLSGAARRRYGLIDGDYRFTLIETAHTWDATLVRRDRDDVDLRAAAPQLARRMRQGLLRFREPIEGGPREVRQQLSESDLEKLGALGYVAEP